MTETTPLDRAHEAMQAEPQNDSARMAFFEVLAATELFLMLEAEADGDQVTPETFETEQGTFVLAFDREDRLSGFAARPAPYVALSGRAIAAMLDELDGKDSATLIADRRRKFLEIGARGLAA